MSSSDFDPWPERALPIGEAVFSQPFDDQSRAFLKGDLWPSPAGSTARADVRLSEASRLVEVIIDYENSKFGYAFGAPGEKSHDSERWTSPLWPFAHSPEWYLEEDAEPRSTRIFELFDSMNEDDQVATWRSLGFTWRGMVETFNRRFNEGELSIYARIGSPLQARVSKIPLDVWNHFNIVDWSAGVDLCPSTKERLYPLHAQENAHARPAFIKRAANSADVGVLEQEIQRRLNAGEPKMKRPEMVALLRERGVSRDSADMAVSQIPFSHRRKRGERDG